MPGQVYGNLMVVLSMCIAASIKIICMPVHCRMSHRQYTVAQHRCVAERRRASLSIAVRRASVAEGSPLIISTSTIDYADQELLCSTVSCM